MISTTTQYALRALTQLAALAPGEVMLGRELARAAEVPANYLSKVLLALKHAGLLAAVRGNHGGYRLSKDPRAIRLVEVVGVFDAQQARRTCLLGKGECSDEDACSAHSVWPEVCGAYLRFLETTTLADISPPAAAEGQQGVPRP